PADHEARRRAPVQAVEPFPPGVVRGRRVEGPDFRPEVVHPRTENHRQIDVGGDRNEDRDRSYAGAAVQPEALLQLHEDADDQGQGQELLDDLEAPQDLAEDSSGEVAGSDLPEDDGSRERDQERAPDPEGEAEQNHLRRSGRAAAGYAAS